MDRTRKLKNSRLNVRESSQFLQRLHTAANLLDKPAAQIVREAVNEKLDELSAKYPELSRRAQQRAA